MHRLSRLAAALGCGALALSLAVPVAAQTTPRKRADIPAEYKWDFSAIYPSWEAWEAGIADMEKKMDAFARLKGTLKRGPAQVLKAYQAYDEIGKLQYLVYRYPQLQRDTDTRDQEVSGRFKRVTAVFAKFDTATSWFTPELLTISQKTMESWIAQTPGLKPYRYTILDEYRKRQHVLDEKGEKLLSFAGQFNATPTSVFQELSTSDIKFPRITTADGKEVTLTPANYSALLDSNTNQADRAKAAAAFLGTYAATANTYAAIYNGVLQRDWFVAQARNYPDTLAAAVDANNVPRAVVETLIEATRAGVAPLQRYIRLKQRLLGLKEFHLYDNFLPVYVSDKKYSYELSRDTALASVAPLGEDYVAKFRKFTSGGRIDVFESEGKRSGAYNAGVYGVGPYMLLNHNDTLDAMFTFAHEAGHGMHTVLSYETQPFVTSSYTIFVAEVASTTNERFLLDHLLKTTTDPKERFLLLQHAVDQIVGTYYTQVMFADYELQAHRLVEKGQPIPAAVLSDIYARLLRDYYGDAITHDEFYKYTWSRIPHFFNTPYYVYQYATCFASSAQLYKAMTTGDEASSKAATERYLTLLKAGGSDYPMDLLKRAGVDLSQRATVQAVIDQMDQLVTQLEAEAAKIR